MGWGRRISAKTRFRVGTGVILLAFCLFVSVIAYAYQKQTVNRSLAFRAEMYLYTAEAIRKYVKDRLRPAIKGNGDPDRFIVEAMSTAFVSREIMNRLGERFPEFCYKRAAPNPRNPVNRSDAFERKMLSWFRQHPEAEAWDGLITREGQSCYTRMIPIRAEADCLKCHGDPLDAPSEIIARYGSSAGFSYTKGELMAADVVYLPVGLAMARVKEKAWLIFITVVAALVFLMALFYLLFNRTVVTELKDTLNRFQKLSRPGDHPRGIPFDYSRDEFALLKEAFQQAAQDLEASHADLRRSEARYRELFEASPDPILICRNLAVFDINSAGLNLFGFTDKADARQVESIYILFWDGRQASAFHAAMKKDRIVKAYEAVLVNREGQKIDAVITAIAAREPEGKTDRYELVIRDITQKRKMDRYLARTEKLASIGQLAAGVAHEINNPLSVISCYTNLIEKNAGADPQIGNDLGVIRKHTAACKSVVRSLLNFARVGDSKMRPTDLHGLMDDILTVLTCQMENRQITLVRDYSADVPRLILDAEKIKQVFMNLFINAFQAMGEQGALTLSTAYDRILHQVMITVTDTGQGIPPDQQDRIFEPFFTTKDVGEGTGLGLSVTYGIISQHGGSLSVISEPGAGTTFRILLPDHLDD
ncbi:MAG: hypothetical protein CSA22_05760 [Deltaproteobacteria bacterium]|nr:MAG: hypothetical protein CSA22_05760 [Deltaproteobacteria bacterium]